jgi:hypothetical protein
VRAWATGLHDRQPATPGLGTDQGITRSALLTLAAREFCLRRAAYSCRLTQPFIRLMFVGAVSEEGDARDFAPLRRRQSSFACRTLQRIDLTLNLRIQPYGKEGGLLSPTLHDLSHFCAQRPEPR